MGSDLCEAGAHSHLGISGVGRRSGTRETYIQVKRHVNVTWYHGWWITIILVH